MDSFMRGQDAWVESPMNKKAWIRLILLGVTLGLLSVGLYFMWLGPRVPAVMPRRGAVIQKVVAAGQIVPHARIKITTQVSGRVEQVFAQEGAKLAAHDPLVSLASDEASSRVLEAQAAHEQAEAKADQFRGVSARVANEALRQAREHLAKARTAAKREKDLTQAHATTQEALDQALSDVRLAESQVAAASAQAKAAAPQGSDSRIALAAVEQSRAALAAAEAHLALYTIHAPMAAQVLQRSVEPGDGVPTGALLFVLGSLEPFRVNIQVDEKYISLIREGQPAKITADAYPGRAMDAIVERLAPAVNADRGALEVQLVIPNAPDFLRFDMSASVEVVTDSAQDVLILPLDAVQNAATDQPFVLTYEHGRVAKKEVTLGLRGDQIIEITAGPGTQDVVLAPKSALPVGTRVRPDWGG